MSEREQIYQTLADEIPRSHSELDCLRRATKYACKFAESVLADKGITVEEYKFFISQIRKIENGVQI